MREKVAILGARLVQVCKVYAHPPLFVVLFDHHHVGQPVGIVEFSNEVCILQLAEFFHYDLVLFLDENLLLLTDRGKSG